MSSFVIRKSCFHLSSSIKIEEEAPDVMIEKQGIVSILGSDCETTKSASLRRTLSADMSSKKWLAQNGFTFSPMKKIASSEELAISAIDHHSSSSSSSSEGEDDVWRSIQSQKEKKPDVWSWSSILVQKTDEDSSKLLPPYVHHSVKRSASSLSKNSLEICTESLGSETGSDGFSSSPPSEVDDVDEEKDNDKQQQPQSQQSSQSFEDLRIVKYNYSSSRKMRQRSFPPPIPWLAREDGASVHMQSHRQDGRLVLEAVSVPSQNYFHAQRNDGRLRLTFITSPSSQESSQDDLEDEAEEFDQVFDNFEEIEGNDAKFDDPGDNGYEEDEEEEGLEDEDIEEEIVEEEKGIRRVESLIEQNSKFPGGLINVHKPALMMKKLMGIDKKNLTWSPRFNKAVNLMGVEEEVEVEDEIAPPLPQSLPPPPRVARLISAPPAANAAASFNAYDYFWRDKPTVASIIKPTSSEENQPLKNNKNKAILASNLKGYEQQNLVLMRGNKADYLVPLLRKCKESRRSLLFWEPYCIATS